ncbi:MAG: succinate dehydrogenase/fumarate reductase iron-sulfur subunit, partial [Myxococcota bacterium]
MKIKVNIWRQKGPKAEGKLVPYELNDVSEHMSFLELLDVLNEELQSKGEEPVAFEHDCREGICGSCAMMINGTPHGPQKLTTTCQLHMRSFNDGDEITVEPWRTTAFPVVKDLVVDRSSFDRIIQAGGYVSVATGNAPDANAMPIGKVDADEAFAAAACIGCGACVAACPNASASLFTSAKLAHLAAVPQGQPERLARAKSMVDQAD